MCWEQPFFVLATQNPIDQEGTILLGALQVGGVETTREEADSSATTIENGIIHR
jgi:hypothetical protein